MTAATTPPIRLALIGAGIFARDAHVPSLISHPDHFEITAIYSRTRASAEALAAHLPHRTEIYTDLDVLLARADIEAVDILLPIQALPGAISRSMAAGKHLLSEKPIAANMATGWQLITQHAHYSNSEWPNLVWMVGENWRYETAFVQAADLIRAGAIGTPLTFHWALYAPFNANSKYYHTPWRHDSSVPGGFIVDGGVHHAAALRLILGEVTAVSATARHVVPDLPPPDTVAATLTFANGVVGTYIATYATAAPWPPFLYIGGSEGSLRVLRKEIELTPNGKTERIETSGFDGVEKELLAFADTIRHGTPHRNTPQEALADLAVIEAMLTSAATGQSVAPATLYAKT
jgi:predicted dehydrogenase